MTLLVKANAIHCVLHSWAFRRITEPTAELLFSDQLGEFLML